MEEHNQRLRNLKRRVKFLNNKHLRNISQNNSSNRSKFNQNSNSNNKVYIKFKLYKYIQDNNDDFGEDGDDD